MYHKSSASYKKTDGDYIDNGAVVTNITWKLWIPVFFIILALGALIIMVAIIVDANVSNVSNSKLRSEIRDNCGDCGGLFTVGSSQKELQELLDERFAKICGGYAYDDGAHNAKYHDGKEHKGGCEREFMDYMNARFQHVYKKMDTGRDSSDHDWSHYMHSSCHEKYGSMKKHFDQRIDYMYELLHKEGSAVVDDLWDVKDLKEYIGDKVNWLGGKLDLIVVNNENDVSNDVDVIIKNNNDIDVDIKNHVDSIKSAVVDVVQDIVLLLNDIEDYLGMSVASKRSQSLNLREFIDDGFQTVEGMLSSTDHCQQSDDDSSTTDAKHWRSSGADTENSKYSEDMAGINSRNVHGVQRRWQYDLTGTVGSSATPTTDGSAVYGTDFDGYVFALSRDTGRPLWKHSVKQLLGINDPDVVIASRNSPVLYDDCAGQPCVIFGAPGDRSAGGYDQFGGSFYSGPAKVIAVNRVTGGLIWISPDLDSHPWSQITGSLTVVPEEGAVFGGINSLEIVAPLIDSSYPCCSFRGSAFKLDARTGDLLWQTYTIPEQSGRNSRTVKAAYSGAGIKGNNPPIDAENRLVFFGTGQFSMFPDRISACLQDQEKNGVFPGESNFNCLEDDLYPDSLLALNMDTGAIVYAHRASGVDGWNPSCSVDPSDPNCPKPIGYDYDFSQSPIVHSVGGETRIFALQKSGVAWSLRASDGAFRWSRYLPTGLVGGGSWGCSHDRAHNGFVCQVTGAPIVLLGHQQQFSYKLADGSIICDASWWFLDAESGEVRWQTASPYARPSKHCPDIVDNPYIRGMRIEGPNGKSLVPASKTARVGRSCAVRDGSSPTAIENSDFARSYGEQAIGNGVVYVTEMTGNMYALDAETGDCLTTMHCEQGAIYGAPSLSRDTKTGDELITVGCGYGRLRKQWIEKAGCDSGKCSITAFGL